MNIKKMCDSKEPHHWNHFLNNLHKHEDNYKLEARVRTMSDNKESQHQNIFLTNRISVKANCNNTLCLLP